MRPRRFSRATAGSAPVTWASWTSKVAFKITDRKKDMIIVSGFKVFPNEVEDVVMLHPGVMEVAAIGELDERTGEAVKIVVVKKDPELTEAALLEHCKKQLDRYKVPKTRRVPHRAPAEDQHRQDPAP